MQKQNMNWSHFILFRGYNKTYLNARNELDKFVIVSESNDAGI